MVVAIVVFDPRGTVLYTTDKLRLRVVVELQKRLPDAKKSVTFIEDLCWMITELEMRANMESKGEGEFYICTLEKISEMVSYIKNFNARGLPRLQKHGGLPAIADGVIKKSSAIVEVSLKQIDEAYEARNEAREIVGKDAKLVKMESGLSESLSLVTKAVSEADGYQPYLIALEQGYRRLIEGALNYFKGPAEALVDAVHFVLKELVRKSISEIKGT